MTESVEQYEKRIAEARLTFSRREEATKTHAAQIQTFASDAMKAPALVAAGGVAAALGFYSANYSRLSSNPSNLDTFNGILFWLFASLLLTVSAPGIAYLSQIAYVAGIYSDTWNYDAPFIHSTRKARFLKLLGDVFRWSSVILIVGSIACLMRSGFLFLSILR